MFNLDLAISQFFFQLGRSIPQVVSVFFASYLIWILIAGVLYVSRQRKERPWRLFIQSLFASGVAYGINAIIAIIYFRVRPFNFLGFDPLIAKDYLDKSFPSDHSAVSWALGFMVFLYNKKYGIILLILSTLIAIGRMLVGVHYFSDILAGALVGIFGAFSFYYFSKSRRIKSWFQF